MWSTGEGNLAATYLFTTRKAPAEAAQVSFVAALAVADLAAAFVPAALVSVKWPNDLLLAGCKAAGILVESGRRADGLWIAVGIGVNLAQAPAALAPPALPPTAFADHMRAPPPLALEALRVLAEAVQRWLGVWESGGFAPIAEAWTLRAHGLGERCRAHLPDGTVEGIAEGLDADGALRLRTADGSVRRITAGDVFF